MEVCTKNILHRFIDGPTHFGMTRGAKMSSTLNELGKLVKILSAVRMQALSPSIHDKWKLFN